MIFLPRLLAVRLICLISLGAFFFTVGSDTSHAQGQTDTQPSVSKAQEQGNLVHASYKPVKGQPHLDFILPSIDDDKRIQLSSYRGKKVLLLHFASW